jgi:hypothetical protein
MGREPDASESHHNCDKRAGILSRRMAQSGSLLNGQIPDWHISFAGGADGHALRSGKVTAINKFHPGSDNLECT